MFIPKLGSLFGIVFRDLVSKQTFISTASHEGNSRHRHATNLTTQRAFPLRWKFSQLIAQVGRVNHVSPRRMNGVTRWAAVAQNYHRIFLAGVLQDKSLKLSDATLCNSTLEER